MTSTHQPRVAWFHHGKVFHLSMFCGSKPCRAKIGQVMFSWNFHSFWSIPTCCSNHSHDCWLIYPVANQPIYCLNIKHHVVSTQFYGMNNDKTKVANGIYHRWSLNPWYYRSLKPNGNKQWLNPWYFIGFDGDLSAVPGAVSRSISAALGQA